MPEYMKKGVIKAFTSTNFWIDAGLLLAGYKVADLVSDVVGGQGALPPLVADFAGPVAVVAGGAAIGGAKGGYFAMGGAMSAASRVLELVGIGA